MAKRDPGKPKREYDKPRLSVQVDHVDADAVDFVAAQLPALEGRQAVSLVVRAALRLGLRELLRKPELVMTTPPLERGNIPEYRGPKGRRGGSPT